MPASHKGHPCSRHGGTTFTHTAPGGGAQTPMEHLPTTSLGKTAAMPTQGQFPDRDHQIW